MIISILCFIKLSAQNTATTNDPEKNHQSALAKYDFSNTSTEVILNASVLPLSMIESFRHKNRSRQGTPLHTTNANDWEMLYRNMHLADMKAKKSLAQFDDLLQVKSLKDRAIDDLIPIPKLSGAAITI